MSTNEKPSRSWQEIARALAQEQNPSKCLELSLELNQVMKEQERKGGANWFAKDNYRLSNTEHLRRI